MSVQIQDSETVTKDPSDVLVYVMDWSTYNLGTSVFITSQVVTYTAVSPSTIDTALTISTSGSGLGIIGSNRKVAVQISGGTIGQLYQITSEIDTNETPSRKKQRSFFLVIEQR